VISQVLLFSTEVSVAYSVHGIKSGTMCIGDVTGQAGDGRGEWDGSLFHREMHLVV
jgi:hypothetical protein